MRDLIRQTYRVLYGDSNEHAGVDAQLCASVIEHSHAFCNTVMEQDDAPSGRIDDLSTELQPTPTDVDEDIEADMEPFAAAEEGDDE